MRTIAMILAGGEGTRLTVLSEERAKPAVPFAGKFRIIDFTISNCVNSGIYTVGILTQYRPHSLNDHIGIGKPWDLDRSRGGVRLLQPYQARKGQNWYAGTADAIYQNLNFIRENRAENVLILSGDHIYKMDYRPMIDYHLAKGADLTVGVMPVPLEETHRFGIMMVDDEQRIVQFYEKPKDRDKGNLASMGIYVFNANTLERRLSEGRPDKPRNDFGKDVIPAMIAAGDSVFALGRCRHSRLVLGDEPCVVGAVTGARSVQRQVAHPDQIRGAPASQSRTSGKGRQLDDLEWLHCARPGREQCSQPRRLCQPRRCCQGQCRDE